MQKNETSSTFDAGPVNFFADMNYVTQNTNVPSWHRKDKIVQPQAGVEWHFWPSFSATVGASYNDLDGVERGPSGTYSQRGYTGFGGLTYYFEDFLSANVTGGLIHNNIHEVNNFTTGTSADQRGANGSFISTMVNGKFQLDDFRLQPTLQYLYYSGVESASIDSTNFHRSADPDSLGRISVGGDVYRGISIDDFYFEPMAHVLYEYNTKLLKNFTARNAVELGGGVNVPVGSDGTTIAFRAYSIVDNSDYSSTLFKLSLYHQF